MESAIDYETARALLEWQLELGASDALGDAPVDRYALSPAATREAPPRTVAQAVAKAVQSAPSAKDAQGPDPVQEARKAAQTAQDLPQLQAAMAAYSHCDLKRGARNLVFCDGNSGARVMIIGEAPGRDEDREGRPFVGRAGQLLDRMFQAIGLGRDLPAAQSVYITNVLPWRPPQNRDPLPEEINMLVPFLQRHVALVDPDLVVLMGNIACQAALEKRGITRLRGQWAQAFDRPAMPMFHPAYLLRNPQAKREAWADLLEIKAKLRKKTNVTH